MHKIHVVSLGIIEDNISPRAKELIRSAKFVAGGRRHLQNLADLTAHHIPIARNINSAMASIRECLNLNDVVVLASGDALFFGIGSRLLEHFSKDQLVFHPNITTIQAACARLKMPWHNILPVSLHGRDLDELRYALLQPENRPIAVFTDPIQTPARLAHWLAENGFEDLILHILEELGGANERISHLSASEARELKFSPLNLVIIPPRPSRPPFALGMPEDTYVHESGLITKREVRAVTISRLMPLYDQIFWDIGAGSGSVGLEASIFLPRGMVFCIEKDINRCKMIEENRKRYGRLNVRTIHGDAPRCLSELPSPQRIFIGGSGGHLQELLNVCWERLETGGKIVVSAVLLKNICVLNEFFHDKKCETIQMQVSRFKQLGISSYAKAENPAWLFISEKVANP
ncbi:MAG: precorrin-6y C5,15-methyltransferase (decarboxylating) subunit CbiE [Dissulfuribacterales bacterium]